MTARVAIEAASARAVSPREIGLWSGAAMVVLGAHLAIAFGLQAAQPVDQVEAMQQALTIDLAPLPITTPEAVEAEGAAMDIPQEVLEPVEETTPAQDPVETTETTPTESTADPVETATAQPERVTPIQPETPEPAEVEAQVTEALAEPDPVAPEVVPPEMMQPSVDADVIEATPPEIVEQVLPDVIAALPEVKPVVREKPVGKVEPPKKATPPKSARKAKPAEKAEAKPAKPAKPAPAKPTAASQRSQKSTASKAPSVNPARWQSKVLAWINRHKRYPRGAKSRGEQGVAQVNFAVDGSGNVVSVSLSRSSGNAELDKAAIDMVRSSSPVPAPPEGLGNRVRLALPVQFSLR